MYRNLPASHKQIRVRKEGPKYLYVDCQITDGEPIYALKIIKKQKYSALLDMEREIFFIFPKEQLYVRVVLDTFTVKYTTDLRVKKVYDRQLKFTNHALFYRRADLSLADLLERQNLSAKQIFTLLLSALRCIQYIHEQGIVMRKISVDTFDVTGQNMDNVIVANFEDACILQSSRFMRPENKDRWDTVQNRVDQPVELMSPELAKFITAERKAQAEAIAKGSLFFPSAVPATMLISSDYFMLAQLAFFMVRKQSLYPKQLINEPLDIVERYNDLVNLYPADIDQSSFEGKIDFIASTLGRRDPDQRSHLSLIIGLTTGNLDIFGGPMLDLSSRMAKLKIWK